MKKFNVIAALLTTAIVFSFCHSAKKVTTTENTLVSISNYETNIKTLVNTNCSPCHIPAKGGNKKAFDTYEAVKANIDSMIYRIELNPGDKGSMPFKHPKLSDSTIAVFKQFRADVMSEK